MKAVLLGASKGMGRALARQMAERGDQLYLLGRSASDLELVARDNVIRERDNVILKDNDVISQFEFELHEAAEADCRACSRTPRFGRDQTPAQ